MGDQAVIVVDTNVLLNLATPVVDGREMAPSGADPLKAVLTTYDVHVPVAVLGELTTIAAGDDLLGAAATAVLAAARWLTEHDSDTDLSSPLADALDDGEARCIALANDLPAEMFVTDEFNSIKLAIVSLAIEDRNTLFTTPQLVCILADRGVLDARYVDHALSYYVETKGWDRSFVDAVRGQYRSTE